MAETIRKPGYSVEHESWFITLTQGVISLVDANMIPILAQHNWYATAQRATWVAMRNQRGVDLKIRTIYMHRIVMNVPDGMVVDHEIHRPFDIKVLDNRSANLRVCTQAQNMMNRRSLTRGSSEFKGVCFCTKTGKWRARIRLGGKQKTLGYFTEEVPAALAYDKAAREHYGEFASTNSRLGLLPREAA